MEQQIWQYYQQNRPGQVQVLGTDVFPSGTNGAFLQQFRINAGNLTFPLLRDCGDGSATNDTNLVVPYNQRDNYVVINKTGIIRYHADDAWDYGNRYHVDELRGTIDSLTTNPADVEGAPSRAVSLLATPNPLQTRSTIAFSNPFASGTRAIVTVNDLAGRRLATLWNGAVSSGVTRVDWNARSDSSPRAPGVYLVQAEIGGVRVTRRVVVIP